MGMEIRGGWKGCAMNALKGREMYLCSRIGILLTYGSICEVCSVYCEFVDECERA